MPQNKFVVMTSAAKMPNSCWGKYANVAVVETNGINMPKQIHPRHKSVISIAFFRGPLNVGTTAACAFNKAVAEATALAAELNALASVRQHALPLGVDQGPDRP